MKRLAAGLLVLLVGCAGGGAGPSPSPTPGPEGSEPAERGHVLYSEGRLDPAEKELREVVARHPKDAFARRLLGRILLLKGRNREAADQFLSYVELRDIERGHIDAATIQDLFFSLYRLDDYLRAAQAMRMLNDVILEEKYKRMAERPPYSPAWREEVSVAYFDEKGLVQIRVNGEPGRFAVDLGAGELLLDREFARRCRATKVGVPRGGADRTEEGFVPNVDFPSLQIRNVPVVIGDLPPEKERRLDGVIGLGILSHFHSTVDFRRGRLVLRKAGSSRSPAGEEWPFLFAGDRILLVPGTMGDRPAWFLVNPGVRELKFVPSPALLSDNEQRRLLGQKQTTEGAVGSLKIAIESADGSRFPSGTDVGLGFQVSGLLGGAIFRTKSLTLDFVNMKMGVE